MNPFQIAQLVLQLLAMAPTIGNSLVALMEAIQARGEQDRPVYPETIERAFHQALVSPGLPSTPDEWEVCLRCQEESQP